MLQKLTSFFYVKQNANDSASDFAKLPPNFNKILFATVFITGAAVLILEVAAVRVLSPIYGSSLYVLSSVLTVILAALSFGYYYGGNRADKEHSVNALYAIITISGLSVLALLTIAKWLLPSLGPLFSTTTGPLLFSFGLFFIPAFLLGIVSPYIIKLQSLVTPPEQIGSVVGATFFWGTFGSIAGSLATGFLLIPHLGVTLTIVMVSVVLTILGIVIPAFIGKTLPIKKLMIITIIVAVFCFVLFSNNHQKQNIVYESEGIYSNITIKDQLQGNRPVRALLRDTNNSAAIYKDSKGLVFSYQRFSLLYDELIPDPKRVLILGGGAYTAPRTLTHIDPELKIDVVEIEPELFALSKKYFDLSDTSNITNYVMDARVFLNKYKGEKYDLIFVDVFSTNLAPPFHLTTKEFYIDLAKNLNPEGVIIFNTIGAIKDSQPSITGSFAKTLKTVFPTVTVYGLNKDPKALQNVMFLARTSNNPINLNSMQLQGTVGNAWEISLTDFALENELTLTDDHAPVEYLMARLR